MTQYITRIDNKFTIKIDDFFNDLLIEHKKSKSLIKDLIVDWEQTYIFNPILEKLKNKLITKQIKLPNNVTFSDMRPYLCDAIKRKISNYSQFENKMNQIIDKTYSN